jgi:hypothetical protein
MQAIDTMALIFRIAAWLLTYLPVHYTRILVKVSRRQQASARSGVGW